MLRQIRNYRWNPFTEASAFSVITDEVHAIPGSGTYWVRLFEVPDENYTDPTSGTPVYIRTIGGTVFTEVSSSPGLNEFRVDYSYMSGWVEFNSGNANDVIYACYRATGSPTEAENINSLQRFDPVAAIFGGDGSDGASVISSDTALSEDPASSYIAFKQYTNLTINAAKTLSLAAGVHGMILCVSGYLSMGASSVIDVDSQGGAGGAANGNPGEYGYFLSGAGGHEGGVTAGGDCNGHIEKIIGPDDIWWRALAHQIMFGAGGGGGAGVSGGAGGNGGGFLIINANTLILDNTVAFNATGANGANASGGNCGGGGGGAGGTVVVLANRIIGETAANLQANNCDVSGGTGGTKAGTGGNGTAGTDGFKRVVELYEYNVY